MWLDRGAQWALGSSRAKDCSSPPPLLRPSHSSGGGRSGEAEMRATSPYATARLLSVLQSGEARTLPARSPPRGC
jgi:hypothetical protein